MPCYSRYGRGGLIVRDASRHERVSRRPPVRIGGMEPNPYEAPRESGSKGHEPRARRSLLITVIGIIATIVMLDLLGFWLSLLMDGQLAK